MFEQPLRYRSDDDDSARWQGFPFRQGDIVISTRSKSGTTWMQMICALLIFQTPELPAPLARLSPWLDWLITPRDEVFAGLEAQDHRRFIKTHTPLDGIPLNPMATYIVVGRHPLDMAVSLYYQGNNINRDRVKELIGQSSRGHVSQAGPPSRPGPPNRPNRPNRPLATGPPRPSLRDWLLSWVDSGARPAEQLDSLRGVLWHLSDAWARQADPGLNGPTVLLVHYDDLSADLGYQMRRLADLLGIVVREEIWPSLERAASFDEMRARAARQAPGPAGVLKDPASFFRRGSSGEGSEVLTAQELASYHARAAELAPAEVLSWLHREFPSQPGRTHSVVAG